MWKNNIGKLGNWDIFYSNIYLNNPAYSELLSYVFVDYMFGLSIITKRILNPQYPQFLLSDHNLNLSAVAAF